MSTKEVSNPYSKSKKKRKKLDPTLNNENPTPNKQQYVSSGTVVADDAEGGSTSSKKTFSQEFEHITSESNYNQSPTNARKRSVDAISNFKTDTVEKESNYPIHDSKESNLPDTKQQQSLDPSALVQPHVLLVSTKQRGNGLLRFIRNVPYAYSKIIPDYILGSNRCALFLSFRYHKLHPNYIHRRIAELKNDFDLRVLLCLVDVEDNASILLQLNKLCAVNSLSLLLAWSEEECARYLESFKVLEHSDFYQFQNSKKTEKSYDEKVCDVLVGKARSLNKPDCQQLILQFGNFKSIATASMEELQSCPGIGEKKVARLFDALHKPFSASVAAKRREEKQHLANIERDIADAEEEESSIEDVDENYEDQKQPIHDQSVENHSSKLDKPISSN